MLFWRNRHEVRDEDLNGFVDGELEESVRQRVERHLESCSSCNETVAELRAMSRAMSELPSVRAPSSFALREADVTPAPVSGDPGLFGSVTPLLSGVTAIAIVAFVVLVGVDITNDGSDFGDSASRTTSLLLEETASLAAEVDDATDQYGDLIEEYFAAEDDGDVAPSVAGMPRQNEDTFTGGYDASANEYDGIVADDADKPLDLEPGEAEEALTDETRSGELAYAGNGKAPALVDDDGGSTGLRVAESIAGAVAIAAAGSVLLIWWRRKSTVG